MGVLRCGLSARGVVLSPPRFVVVTLTIVVRRDHLRFHEIGKFFITDNFLTVLNKKLSELALNVL